MLRLIEKAGRREEDAGSGSLDVLAREGARRMLVTALEAEVGAYLERYADERDEDGTGMRWWFGTERPAHGRSR